MKSLALQISLLFFLVIIPLYWVWRHRRLQKQPIAFELPMQEVSDSTRFYEEAGIRFHHDGPVLFLSQNHAEVDGTGIDYQDENGLRAFQERGASKPLYLTDAEGTVHVFRRKGEIWYRLVPREKKIGTFDAAARLLRQRGPQGVGFYVGACLYVCAMTYGIVDIIGFALSQEQPPPPKPVTSLETPASPPVLITPAESPITAITFASDRELVWATGASLTVWDPVAATRLHQVLAPGGGRPSISFLAAPPCGGCVAAVVDNEVSLWNSRDGWRGRPKPKRSALAPFDMLNSPPQLPDFNEPVPTVRNDLHVLAFSPDGQVLAVASGFWSAAEIEILDVDDLRPITAFPVPGDVVSLAWAPNSRHLAVATVCEHVGVWHVPTRRQVTTLNSPTPCYSQDGWPDCRLAYSPRGVLATSWPSAGVQFVDTAAKKLLGSVDMPGPIDSLAYVCGGRLVVALLPDGAAGAVALIDVAANEVVAKMTPSVTSWNLAVSPGGMIAICGYERIQLISVFDVLKHYKVKKPVRQDSDSLLALLRRFLVAGDEGEANWGPL